MWIPDEYILRNFRIILVVHPEIRAISLASTALLNKFRELEILKRIAFYMYNKGFNPLNKKSIRFTGHLHVYEAFENDQISK